TARSWRWRATCPDSRELVQVVYFSPSAGQFVSRKVAGVKSRRVNWSKVRYRHWDRMWAIMNELEVNHLGCWAPRPLWMTEARFERLTQELVMEDIRRMNAGLGLEAPDFGD